MRIKCLRTSRHLFVSASNVNSCGSIAVPFFTLIIHIWATSVDRSLWPSAISFKAFNLKGLTQWSYVERTLASFYQSSLHLEMFWTWGWYEMLFYQVPVKNWAWLNKDLSTQLPSKMCAGQIAGTAGGDIYSAVSLQCLSGTGLASCAFSHWVHILYMVDGYWC